MKKSNDDDKSDKSFPEDGKERVMGETWIKVHRPKPCHDNDNLTEEVNKRKKANQSEETDETFQEDGREEAMLKIEKGSSEEIQQAKVYGNDESLEKKKGMMKNLT